MNVLESLQDRDRKIVELILQGYTVPQIAATMSYSAQSIKTYKRTIYKLLGVHDKKELHEKIFVINKETV